MITNKLRPVAELAADKPHGSRIRYMGGCKCTLCKAANSRYETERAAARRRGEWNGLVDAEKVRHHLIALSKKGIGRDTIADLTGIAASTIDLIRRGERKNLRAMNAKRILAIDLDSVVHDAQLIPARETWQRIRYLLKIGFTKATLAKRLGYRSPSLQINRKTVTARNALKVERLYNQMYGNPVTPDRQQDLTIRSKAYADLCLRCPLPDCVETSPQCLIQIQRKGAS